MIRISTTTFLGFVLLAAACGDDASDSTPPPPVDSGRTDSGTPMPDGSTTPDTGTRTDSGMGADSGMGTDSGMATDSGTGTDGIYFSSACPAFTPCGGALEGTWTYGDVCIDPAEVEALLSGVCAEVMFVDGSGTVNGSITFTAATVSRTIDTSVDVTLNIPMSCWALGCGGLGPVIMAASTSVDSATCVAAAGGRNGCDCDIGTSSMVRDTDEAYTVTGNTIEITSTTRRWDYCVEAPGLRIHEIMSGDGGDPNEPGVQTLDGPT